MKVDLLAQLKRHEGYSSKAYQDSVGVWTIGYGTNLQELSISILQADSWLIQAMQEAELQLLRRYSFVSDLSESRQNVLINMTYNMGINRLSRFRKMWLALKAGDFDEACLEMIDSKWFNQVGERALELVNQMQKG